MKFVNTPTPGVAALLMVITPDTLEAVIPEVSLLAGFGSVKPFGLLIVATMRYKLFEATAIESKNMLLLTVPPNKLSVKLIGVCATPFKVQLMVALVITFCPAFLIFTKIALLPAAYGAAGITI